MKLKKMCVLLCLVTLCIFEVMAQDASGAPKRKKLRRKMSEIQNENVTATTTTTTTATPLEDLDIEIEINPSQPDLVSEEDEKTDTTERAGRGFLDEYYKKFEDRVQVSQMDKSRGNERMDSSSGLAQLNILNGMDLSDPQPEVSDVDNDVTKMSAEHRSVTPGDFRAFPSETTMNFFKSSAMKKSPPLTLSMTSGSPMLTEYGGEGRYMQQVSLPKHLPGDKSYMFSALPVDDEPPAITMTKSKRKSMSTNLVPPSDKYELSGIESLLSGPPEKSYMSSDKGYLSSPSTSYDNSVSYDPVADDTRDPMSKFFGLTGTTSHDIQLGLTFTVPFLSIPLNSINSMFNGDGLSDLMDFNFSTTSLITVGIMAVLVIFVLPQIIYWLTGVNLSAFNWGRNDDDHGIQMTSLAHTVDEALLRYDIDTKTCLARTMCSEYQKRADDKDTTGRLSRGILENIADNNLVKKYIGESRITEALGLGSSGKNCADYYSRDVCPWDTSAMIKIASKILTSGNIDFASIATAAATAAATTMAASGGARK